MIKQWVARCLMTVSVASTLSLSATATLHDCMEQAIDTWSITDLTRAIASKDRVALYPNLLQAHLDLYATVHWCAKTKEPRLHEASLQELEDILRAIESTSLDIFTTPRTQEEHVVEQVLKHTVGAWQRLKSPSEKEIHHSTLERC